MLPKRFSCRLRGTGATGISMFKRCGTVVLVISASACGDGNQSPSAPSTSGRTTDVPTATSTIHLTGVATGDDGSAVAGATVTVRPYTAANSGTSVSAVTDGRGFYSIDFEANRDAVGGVAFVYAESAGHDPSYYYLKPPSQNALQDLHLYRNRRITAGDSTILTVVPGDTSCGDSDQFVCRRVHILAPRDGRVNIEAVPTPAAANAGLEILGRGAGHHCCATTASVPVTAGTEVVANIGMWWTSTASQSFSVNTSLIQP
jgi:hypothetical protein